MPDEISKRASFGFDADFGDLSKVKPTGTPRAIPPKPKTSKPKTAPASLTKPKARKTKPKPRVRKTQDDLADKLAKSQGFTSREAQAAPLLMKKRRRVQHDEPVDQLSIRGPVRVLNGFIDYCEANKLSYWEGLERLVTEAE